VARLFKLNKDQCVRLIYIVIDDSFPSKHPGAQTNRIRRRAISLSALAIAGLSLMTSCSVDLKQVPQSSNPEGKSPLPPGKVLFLLSSSDKVSLKNGESHSTGTFYGEFIFPALKLREAGYDLVIATPKGELPVVDPVSLEDRYLKPLGVNKSQAIATFADLIESTPRYSIKQAIESCSEFQGLVVPGGQGLMSDLIDNKSVHLLVRKFGDAEKPVGMICHAPAILARMPAAHHPFRDHQVTSVSSIEEWYIETFVMGGQAEIRNIKALLRENGMRTAHHLPGRSKAVRDRWLVTSQNPFSDLAFTNLYLETLSDWRHGGISRR